MPQLLAATGATRFTDPKNFPWTIAFNPNYQSEAHIYAKFILDNHPNAKIGILYQNDDLGKDYVKGLKDGLGAKASMIVAETSYELSDPTVDSQMVTLRASGADLFYNITTPKFGAQAIKKAAELGWKPVAHSRHQRDPGQPNADPGRVLRTPRASSRSITARTRSTRNGPTMRA